MLFNFLPIESNPPCAEIFAFKSLDALLERIENNAEFKQHCGLADHHAQVSPLDIWIVPCENKIVDQTCFAFAVQVDQQLIGYSSKDFV